MTDALEYLFSLRILANIRMKLQQERMNGMKLLALVSESAWAHTRAWQLISNKPDEIIKGSPGKEKYLTSEKAISPLDIGGGGVAGKPQNTVVILLLVAAAC